MKVFKLENHNGTYSCQLNIAKEEWLSVLNSPSCKQDYIDKLLLFFDEPDYTASCKHLAAKHNINAQAINSQITHFGMLASNILNIHIERFEDTKETYWPLPMAKGNETEDGLFEWTLRSELAEALKDYEILRFKHLLEYFVAHLEYCDSGIESNHGYSTYIKPLLDSKDFKYTGQGYKGNSIQNQINNWSEYSICDICINIQPNYGGNYRTKKCYLNWRDTGINIYAEWDKSNVKSLIIGYCYWWNKPCLYEDVVEKQIADLGLFDDNYPNDELKGFYNHFKGELEQYYNEEGKYFEKEKKHYENQKLEQIMADIQPKVNLLTTNYNLILTGAPGTGKTYLAKQIAQQIAAQNTYNPKELLEQIIGRFKHSDEETKRLNELRAVFLKRFPKEKLKDLTLEQYCIGDGGKDNFCWWIERGLTALGKYFPGSSRSYLVYRNKESLDYVFTGFLKNKKKDSNTNITNESLMKELASEISECVEKQKNIHNYLGDSFLLKILSTYYPNDFFPINSKTYLDNVIDLFGLENQKDILDKNKVVYNFYKIACKDRKDITVDEFAYILYSNFDLKTGEAVDSLKQRDSKEDYGFVQFHPSYDYTDFVEGLRPIQDENGNVGFERKDGVFKEFCVKALNNPNKNYVFIIDEINRGEISKIFGELFFSIDPDYRGENGKVRTQYANMQTVPNDFDDKLGITDDNNFGHFFVPENVYIIGTMNDIDRSVESMDFAFRRRFAFKEIKADESMKMLDDENAWKDEQDNIVKPSTDVLKKLKDRMSNLNNMIWHEAKTDEKEEEKCIDGLSSAYHIGAAYFLKLKNYRDDADNGFENLWNNHLEGLLREYLRGSLNIEESIAKLKAAYNNGSPENNG